MTDRAMPGVDGPPACPFIAFEDERDERASAPDHRHRCFAEIEPAPRALAHQEAYCLSSAFPVCPTFQDWARREAAQARSGGRSPAVPPVGASVEEDAPQGVAPEEPETMEGTDEPSARPRDDDDDPWAGPPPGSRPLAPRNPPRDWAAPPPWASGVAAGGAAGPRSGATDGRPATAPASPSASQGLAGSTADRWAGGAVPGQAPAGASSDDLGSLVAPAAAVGAASAPPPPISRPPSGSYPTTAASGRRPTVSSTRDRSPAPVHSGPSWEQSKRYEAYPTIKTRAGLPGIPRIAVWGGALAIAALALFFLPAMFGIGGGDTPGPTATPSDVAPTASPSPTPEPVPTPQVYVIKSGDTLSKIAKRFDVTVDDLIAANKATIKNPDKISVGVEIIIPIPVPEEFTDPSAAAPDETTPEP